MKYLTWFVVIAALAIAYWTNVVLVRLLVSQQCPFDHAAAPSPAAAPPAKDEPLDLRKLRGEASSCALPGPDYKPGLPPSGENPISKSALVGGLNAVRPQIHACYERFGVPGTAMVNIVIAKSGRVSCTQVIGKFAGTPTGACVQAAVRTARFPPSDGIATPYPFQLK